MIARPTDQLGMVAAINSVGVRSAEALVVVRAFPSEWSGAAARSGTTLGLSL